MDENNNYNTNEYNNNQYQQNNYQPQNDWNNRSGQPQNNRQPDNSWSNQQFNQPPQPQSNSNSTASLVLGIVSLGLDVICCGGGIISIVCAIIGLVLGIPEMKRNPNDSKAKVGVILSAIGLGLSVITTIIVIICSVTTGLLSELIYDISWMYDI